MGDEEDVATKKGGMKPLLSKLRALSDHVDGLDSRIGGLEGGHSNENTHEDYLECPECYGLVKRANYIKHTEKHKEKPKTILHPFSYGLGYCKTCNQVEARDLSQVVSHLPDLLKYVKEKATSPYECINCHIPLEDVAQKECPLCSSTKAIRRKPKF